MYQGRFNANSGSSAPARRFPLGTVIFYAIFFLLIAAFIIGLNVGLGALEDWLGEFELSQSTIKSQEVYQELYADPDWAKLYTMTNQQDTLYEGVDAYVAHMTQLVNGQKLIMAKTSAGLDKSKEKYLILLDKSPISSFTLKNVAAEGAQMPQWELDSVEISFKRQQSVQIVTTPGHQVFVNGVALDDSHVVSTTTTLAEKYLPQGLHGFRKQILHLEGLLVAPTVTIQDANGSSVPVSFDAATNTYSETFPTQKMTDEIKERAIEAAKLYARYTLINNEVSSKTTLQSHFDKNGETYKSLPPKWELWIQSNNGYKFSEPVVSDYYAYSDSLYSIRISLTTTVTRTDGTTKDYLMDTTYFFHLTGGKWLVDKNTNEEIQNPITQVKLTYMVDGELLHSEFADASASQITLPSVTAPEGKAFLGWFSKEIGQDGKITMHLVFSPSETGIVYLPEGTELKAMELYAQFGTEEKA